MAEDTRPPDGALTAQRDAPVGGQAVLEGVMMRGVSTWAVAVRTPLPEQLGDDGEGLAADEAARGEIAVQSFPLVSWTKRHRALRWPVIRGVVALVESLVIGFKALGISANAQLGEEEEPISGGMWAGTVVAALALAIGLFFVVPVGVTSLFKDHLGSAFLFWLVEGLLRTAIFLGYLWLLSRLRDLRRVFEYHGAEHKVISTFEAGEALTPENARRYSRLHPRCGTSFLLIVMIVAIFVFAPLGLPAWYLLVASRILGVPLIAGLSFEVIKWAGRNRRKPWVRSVMWPGMQLQKLTTREPDLDQLAVAIAAMEAVLAVEDPRGASEEDRVGMEVVA
ncbi:MAG: DUF1385 domain-containing protein [Actinomycetota bacterium]|nr:DUF1385 domain-containing protein [Actinomycetota bacterium]